MDAYPDEQKVRYSIVKEIPCVSSLSSLRQMFEYQVASDDDKQGFVDCCVFQQAGQWPHKPP